VKFVLLFLWDLGVKVSESKGEVCEWFDWCNILKIKFMWKKKKRLPNYPWCWK